MKEAERSHPLEHSLTQPDCTTQHCQLRCITDLVNRSALSSVHNLHLPSWLQIYSFDIPTISRSTTDQYWTCRPHRLVNAVARVRSRDTPCRFLAHKVTLGDNLLLQLWFYSASSRFRSVPYLFLALRMSNGHTEDVISADHRRIPNIWITSKPPPSTMDMQFDDKIGALSSVLHSHTASVTVHRSSTQQRLKASPCPSISPLPASPSAINKYALDKLLFF